MRNGFTLIELLVVITIIVVLLALLTPALDKAIEQAERMQCAAQLHLWGTAIVQYSFQHRRTLMSTLRFGIATGKGATYPNLAWARSAQQAVDYSDPQTKGEQWCAERMKPYVGGVVGTDNLGWKAPWYCPSNAAPAKDEQNITAAEVSDWFVSDYAYFARSEIWGRDHASRPQDLTAGLSGGRLLMADAIYDYRTQGTWWFNHGTESHSTHEQPWGGPVEREPDITGTNQLFGDGSATWKDVSQFAMDDLVEVSENGNWVKSNANTTLEANNHY